MLEFDLFIPLNFPDGKPVNPGKLSALKKRLVRRFGGLTYFPQQNEGLWKFGKYTYRDKIVILRVIGKADQPTRTFLTRLKLQIAADWNQQNILIVSRAIKIL